MWLTSAAADSVRDVTHRAILTAFLWKGGFFLLVGNVGPPP